MLDNFETSDFSDFLDQDMHMMLNKNNVMLTVIDRIDEKYGAITALNLSVIYFLIFKIFILISIQLTELFLSISKKSLIHV